MVTRGQQDRWGQKASTPRILCCSFLFVDGTKAADTDVMFPSWKNSQQPLIAVTDRFPFPAVGPRWPRPVPGAGLQDTDAEAALESYWLRMNLSFQKRALELKGAIQSVCWGAPCPQRALGGPPSVGL